MPLLKDFGQAKVFTVEEHKSDKNDHWTGLFAKKETHYEINQYYDYLRSTSDKSFSSDPWLFSAWFLEDSH